MSKQWNLPENIVDMTGKTSLITGGNSGIGKATALGLARMGATVIIVSRDKERGEVALADIIAKSGNQNLELMLADMSSQDSVRRLASDFKARHEISDAHNGAKVDFEDLQGEKKFSGWHAYGQSKLAMILFTHELAKKLDGTGVTVNSAHPGVVRTNFANNNGGKVFSRIV